MIELSRYALEALRKDEEFILYRGRSQGDPPHILVLSPIAEYPTPESLNGKASRSFDFVQSRRRL